MREKFIYSKIKIALRICKNWTYAKNKPMQKFDIRKKYAHAKIGNTRKVYQYKNRTHAKYAHAKIGHTRKVCQYKNRTHAK